MTLLAEDRLLTVGEVALRLRQSEATVRAKINAGDLPAIKIGSGPRAPIRVGLAELETWLTASRAASAERRADLGVDGAAAPGREGEW